ncbi:hypothetical protein ACFYXV_32450 [Streptomyces sp. NPDC002181]|uniref:hypothetical protein n=1 Tax=Streptomyces sp. NPDC002181 TaxID=3364635 RepID=UPI0036C35D79
MATAIEPRTTASTTPRVPVMLSITPRPTDSAAGPLPVGITSRPIADDGFRITKDIGSFSEALGCSCQADDDQPY